MQNFLTNQIAELFFFKDKAQIQLSLFKQNFLWEEEPEFKRSWVQITAPDTEGTFLHLFGLKLHYLFEKAPKMNKKRQLMTQLSKILFNITMLKKRFTKAKAWSEATLVISLTIGLPSSSSSSSS